MTAEVEDAHKDGERLHADVGAIQAFVASLPDRDIRSPEDIIGYDEFGLPS